jgi:hypothetical protein
VLPLLPGSAHRLTTAAQSLSALLQSKQQVEDELARVRSVLQAIPNAQLLWPASRPATAPAPAPWEAWISAARRESQSEDHDWARVLQEPEPSGRQHQHQQQQQQQQQRQRSRTPTGRTPQPQQQFADSRRPSDGLDAPLISAAGSLAAAFDRRLPDAPAAGAARSPRMGLRDPRHRSMSPRAQVVSPSGAALSSSRVQQEVQAWQHSITRAADVAVAAHAMAAVAMGRPSQSPVAGRGWASEDGARSPVLRVPAAHDQGAASDSAAAGRFGWRRDGGAAAALTERLALTAQQLGLPDGVAASMGSFSRHVPLV